MPRLLQRAANVHTDAPLNVIVGKTHDTKTLFRILKHHSSTYEHSRPP